MPILAELILPGVVFVLTLAFGFWLSRSGKPYNGLLFNLHKLIALGTVILAVLRFMNILGGAPVALPLALLLGLAALCAMALFASGAMLSAGKLNQSVMLAIHRVAPALAVPAIAGVLVLLVAR